MVAAGAPAKAASNWLQGEVRRRLGDFAAAEEAFAKAHEYAKPPQPGLSLLRLAQGKPEAAASGVARALAEVADRPTRARLLAAQVEIALATGELATAEAATEELESIVADLPGTALEAMAAACRGALNLVQGDVDEAITHLHRSLRLWQEAGALYETIEIRLLLGRAYRAAGDEEGAEMELRAARSAFERMGATWNAERAGVLLAEAATSAGSPERVRLALMFTDIVRSTDLVGAIGDEAWEDLLSWHDQTLRSLFATNGGEVAHHTGDGFFVAFGDSTAALRCAVAIQRALAEHRKRHGFSPSVRIGIHTAEATRRGQDYSGAEVHKAARIADLAEGGEILASEETLAEADGSFTASRLRKVKVRGAAEPVRVAKVEWR